MKPTQRHFCNFECDTISIKRIWYWLLNKLIEWEESISVLNGFQTLNTMIMTRKWS